MSLIWTFWLTAQNEGILILSFIPTRGRPHKSYTNKRNKSWHRLLIIDDVLTELTYNINSFHSVCILELCCCCCCCCCCFYFVCFIFVFIVLVFQSLPWPRFLNKCTCTFDQQSVHISSTNKCKFSIWIQMQGKYSKYIDELWQKRCAHCQWHKPICAKTKQKSLLLLKIPPHTQEILLQCNMSPYILWWL